MRAGRRYTLASFASAKALVLVFTANHCPTAQAYEDRIRSSRPITKIAARRSCSSRRTTPLAVRLDELGYTDLGDTCDDMKMRARPLVNFPTSTTARRKRCRSATGAATPHVFVFDRERKLRFSGRIDDHENPAKTTTADARAAIDAMLAAAGAGRDDRTLVARSSGRTSAPRSRRATGPGQRSRSRDDRREGRASARATRAARSCASSTCGPPGAAHASSSSPTSSRSTGSTGGGSSRSPTCSWRPGAGPSLCG